MPPLEGMSVKAEKGRCGLWSDFGGITIKNGTEKPPRAQSVAFTLLSVALGHFVLDTPFADVLGSASTILDGATIFRVWLWKAGL